jgi:hypothetical protein
MRDFNFELIPRAVYGRFYLLHDESARRNWMVNDMPLDVSRAPSTTSPLWIIALFIALSEATAGVASITTNGATRLIFAIFAVAFPIIVFAVFTWLLTAHTAKLYPPDQYSENITPGIYNEGVNAHRQLVFTHGTSAVFAKAVAETIRVPLADEGGKFDNLSPAEQQDELYRAFELSVRESTVTVDISPIAPGADPRLVPVSEATTVAELLDDIYFSLVPRVKPYEYMKSWMLREPSSGRIFKDMGTRWAQDRGAHEDTRLLSEVGISPSSELEVVSLKPSPPLHRRRFPSR